MLAELYHLHHQFHLEDLPFWQNLAAQYGSPILELGCGTGRVTLPLLRHGFDITGIDMDPDMLSILKNEIKSEESPEILQEDFTALNLTKKFPLIIMPCNTYSTLAQEDRHAVIERVIEHLKPHGIFAFSMPNPAWMGDLPAEAEPEIEEIFVIPKSGDAVQVSSAWQNDGKVVKVFWHYDKLLPDGQVERITAKTTHQLTSAYEYLTELKQKNFTLKIYGGFDRSPYSPDADYLIIVAKYQ